MNLAATIARMEAAGMAPEAILLALKCIVEDEPKPVSKDEAILARKREADRVRMAERRATSRDCSATTEPKESSPIPPKENTINNSLPNAREPGGEAVATPPVKTSKRSRLPADWSPGPAVLDLARSLGFSATEINDQLQRFHDWAVNAPSSSALKSDWNAAFRNWLKRSADDKRKSGSKGARPSVSEQWRDAFDRVDEAIKGGVASARHRLDDWP